QPDSFAPEHARTQRKHMRPPCTQPDAHQHTQRPLRDPCYLDPATDYRRRYRHRHPTEARASEDVLNTIQGRALARIDATGLDELVRKSEIGYARWKNVRHKNTRMSSEELDVLVQI